MRWKKYSVVLLVPFVVGYTPWKLSAAPATSSRIRGVSRSRPHVNKRELGPANKEPLPGTTALKWKRTWPQRPLAAAGLQ